MSRVKKGTSLDRPWEEDPNVLKEDNSWREKRGKGKGNGFVVRGPVCDWDECPPPIIRKAQGSAGGSNNGLVKVKMEGVLQWREDLKSGESTLEV